MIDIRLFKFKNGSKNYMQISNKISNLNKIKKNFNIQII